ncbi:class I SAM-dependent methyltransferase [archaeon]|nr:class I SAM-dependent methyltransferase [archaeon]
MEKSEYKNIFELEKNHWWYKGIRESSLSILKPYLKKNIKILDAGCGTGFNIQVLKKYGYVGGIDFSEEAVKFCRKKGINIKKGSVEKLPFKDNSFDLITCFEVIYHKGVKSDLKALNEFNRVLKKNGLLLVRVPAFEFLRGPHDDVVHGIRRYNKKSLSLLLRKSKFNIVKITYLNFILFFPVLITRFLMKKKNTDIQETSKLLNFILYMILKFEKIFLKLGLPFGVSLIALAKKY